MAPSDFGPWGCSLFGARGIFAHTMSDQSSQDLPTLPDASTMPIKRERDEQAPDAQPSTENAPQRLTVPPSSVVTDPVDSMKQAVVIQHSDDHPPADLTLQGRTIDPMDDVDPQAAITPEQAERIAKASTQALEAKVGEIAEPFRSAIKAELKRRKSIELAKKMSKAIPVAKVIKEALVWRDGFMSTIPAGTLVSRSEGARLSAEGHEVKLTFAKVEPNALNVMEMREVELHEEPPPEEAAAEQQTQPAGPQAKRQQKKNK